MFAYVKFQSAESAEKAMRVEGGVEFHGQKLLVNHVLSVNEGDLEANLFTKNLLPSVTEEQIFKAFSLLVPV
jgi:RNA recognition motif-containing protein